jgi:hypothetical protein
LDATDGPERHAGALGLSESLPLRFATNRDTKFFALFRDTLATAKVKCLALRRRSPNLNAFAE